MVVVFFFKQKTAYEMRISDWSSDVCSSDLLPDHGFIGCEPFLNGVVGALQHIRDGFLPNIRLHMGNALDVLARVPDGALSFVYLQIGRASCRESVCQYVSLSVVAGSLKKKITRTSH